jgi:hypothetical protein
MVRKDDPAFKKAVDDAIVGLYNPAKSTRSTAAGSKADPA